jgi:hypothetical protein
MLQMIAKTKSDEQGTKKRKNVPPSQITRFFSNPLIVD